MHKVVDGGSGWRESRGTSLSMGAPLKCLGKTERRQQMTRAKASASSALKALPGAGQLAAHVALACTAQQRVSSGPACGSEQAKQTVMVVYQALHAVGFRVASSKHCSLLLAGCRAARRSWKLRTPSVYHEAV